MISGDAPPFIILVLAASMMGVVIGAIAYLDRLGLLRLPVFFLFPKFTIFHYNVFVLTCYTIAQFLGCLKIISGYKSLDKLIMYIFIWEDATLILFILALWLYRAELVPTPPKGLGKEAVSWLFQEK